MVITEPKPKPNYRTGTVNRVAMIGLRAVARWSVGTCYRCALPLIKGEDIIREHVGWVHLACQRDKVRVVFDGESQQ